MSEQSSLSDSDSDVFLKNRPSPEELEEFLKGNQDTPSWHNFAKGGYINPAAL